MSFTVCGSLSARAEVYLWTLIKETDRRHRSPPPTHTHWLPSTQPQPLRETCLRICQRSSVRREAPRFHTSLNGVNSACRVCVHTHTVPRSTEYPPWDWRESRDFDELNHILRESKKLGKALESLSRSELTLPRRRRCWPPFTSQNTKRLHPSPCWEIFLQNISLSPEWKLAGVCQTPVFFRSIRTTND